MDSPSFLQFIDNPLAKNGENPPLIDSYRRLPHSNLHFFCEFPTDFSCRHHPGLVTPGPRSTEVSESSGRWGRWRDSSTGPWPPPRTWREKNNAALQMRGLSEIHIWWLSFMYIYIYRERERDWMNVYWFTYAVNYIYIYHIYLCIYCLFIFIFIYICMYVCR